MLSGYLSFSPCLFKFIHARSIVQLSPDISAWAVDVNVNGGFRVLLAVMAAVTLTLTGAPAASAASGGHGRTRPLRHHHRDRYIWCHRIADVHRGGGLAYRYHAGGSTSIALRLLSPARGTVGVPLSVQLGATDPMPGQAPRYSAASLPPGLSIDPASGLVSGTPTRAGGYRTAVWATDTVTGVTSSQVSRWSIGAVDGNGVGTVAAFGVF
jgi:hypothetical protein